MEKRPMERRIAWVTGGGGAIGRSVCERLLAEGARVGVLDLDGPGLASVRTLGVEAVACDLADPRQIDSAATELREILGRADMLVNVAGISHDHLLTSLPLDDWARVIAIDITAPFLLTQLVLPDMIANGFGRIVNISSNAGVIPVPRRVAYCVAKAGLDALTRSIALEAGTSGVTANTVAPGFIDTPLARAAFGGRKGLEEAVRTTFRNPMELVLDPADIAAAVAFFCHPQARGVTGQRLHVDAGMYMP